MTIIKKKFLLIKSSNLHSLVDNHQINNDETDLEQIYLIKLKHPKQNVATQFCLIQNDLYEMIEYSTSSNDLTSVFVDDYVQSDCYTYFVNKFNLTYFIISFLLNDDNSSNIEFKSLDDFKLKLIDSICEDNNDNNRDKLRDHLKFIDKSQLEKVFDLKQGSNDSFQLKFNLAKCLEWLANKVENIRIYLNGVSKSENEFGSKLKVEEGDSSKSKLHSFELVAQYISCYLASKLRKELNLSSPLDDDSNGVKSQLNSKRQKQETIVL